MSEAGVDIQALTELFHEYSAEDIAKAARNTEAFANAVYAITDTQGERYFLKILKNQLPEVIATEVQMQQRLLAAGLKTPEYLEIKPGRYVGDHNGTRFLLSKYVPGESPKKVTPKLIESFGATLAILHDALTGLTIPPNSMQWLNPEHVAHDLARYDGPAKNDLLNLVQTGQIIFTRNLPTAVTHGDLWLNNVFAKDDKVSTIFDLETAEETVRLVDLARTFTSMKVNSDYPSDKILELLTKGYDSAANVPLDVEEQANLPLAIAFVAGACATWHALHGTRYTDPYITFGKEALGLDTQ